MTGVAWVFMGTIWTTIIVCGGVSMRAIVKNQNQK